MSILGTGGCDDPSGGPELFVVAANGDTIDRIEIVAEAVPATEVEMVLGETTALGKVGDIAVQDGRLLVGDLYGDNLIAVADGEITATIGRAGDGPGEFRRPSRVRFLSDSRFEVFDAVLMRLTRYSWGREYDESVNIENPGFPNAPQAVGWLERGDLVLRSRDFDPGRGRLVQQFSKLYAVGPEGRIRELGVRLPDGHLGRLDGLGMVVGPLLEPRLQLAVGGGEVVAITGARSHLEFFDRRGERTRRIVIARDPLVVDDEVAELIRHWFLRAYGDDEANRRFVDRAPIPDTLPAFDAIRGVGSSEVWARRLRGMDLSRTEVGRRWLKLCLNDLRSSRFVVLPNGFEPVSRNGPHLYGVSRDRFEVETVGRVQVGACPAP